VEARRTGGSTALALLGGFGPSLAAVVVVAHQGGRGVLRRWLSRCLQWRVGWRWMAGAFFFPAGCMGLAAATHVALGGTLPPSPAAGHILLAALNFVLVFLVGGPLGEEFGWRGYALPALQRRWGWRSASLVLGGAWTLWHVPLFYSAGTVQSHLPMGLYALSAIASSVLFAWLFNRTAGSVLPVLVLHTAVNAWSSVIPVMVQPDGSNLRPFQWVVGTLVFAAVLLLLCGRAPRRRLRRAPGVCGRVAVPT
jgi:membrane protease YdiL (CAAX protease family)